MLKNLLEKRATLATEVKRLADLHTANGDFTADERAAWEKVNSDYDANTRSVEVAQRAATIDSESVAALSSLARPEARGVERVEGLPTEEHRQLAMRAWVRSAQGNDPTDAELDACKRLKFNPNKKELDIPTIPTAQRKRILDEVRSAHPSRRNDILHRALSAVTGATGAFTILPASMVQQLEINMLAYGSVEAVAETINTSSGEPLVWPTADDTSNTGAQIGENTAAGTSSQPAFTTITWNAYKFTSNGILVPNELLEDSQFDVAGMIGAMLGERLGRIANTKFTTGTGAATPKGITLCAAAGVTAASATAIAADEIIKLTGGAASIDPAYRNQGAGFMMHDNILHALRLLKDGNGQYLWGSGMNSGAPDTICGYPVYVNQDMASSIAASAITVLFGLFSKYKVRRVGGTRLYHLTERYRDTDQDGFFGFQRFDGNLLSAGTSVVKKLVQA
jgi:HK97 family phage major capsid protein